VVGDPIHWSRIASSAVVSLAAGLVGGMLGTFLLAQGVRATTMQQSTQQPGRPGTDTKRGTQ